MAPPIDVEDRSGQSHAPKQVLEAQIVPGSVCPRYDATVEHVIITKVVITEQGTQNGLPVVDVEMEGHDGKKFFTCLTGRHLTAIAAMVAGINLRNHGTSDP